MPTAADLVNFAINSQATKFTNAFDHIVGQRSAERLNDYKITVAQNMYGEKEIDETESEDLEGVELEDEDIDLDLDDEDLNSEIEEILNSEEDEYEVS